jgi:oligosaccharide repeat unit polymerase
LFKKGADVISPMRLYAIIWSLAIGMAELKLSRFQNEWSAYSWIVMSTCILGTLIGMFALYVVNFGKASFPVSEIREYFKSYNIKSKYLFFAVIALFISYIVSYVAIYLIQGYIPYFTLHPDTARTKWGGIFGIGLLVQAIPSILYLVFIYYVFVRKEKLKKTILVIIALLTVITYLFILQRYFLILPLIMVFVLGYYCTKKISKRNVLIFVLLAGIILYGISSLRVSAYAFNILYVISEMKVPVKYAFISEPYMYVVMNLENFARACNYLDNFNYGFFTFDFVLALTGVKASLTEYLRAPQFPYIITNSFNTYTMYFEFYRDFGIYGTGFLSFAFGAFASHLFYRLKRKPDLNSISMYAVCIFVIIFSFFVPIISWLIFVFNVIVIYYVTKKIQIKD